MCPSSSASCDDWDFLPGARHAFATLQGLTGRSAVGRTGAPLRGRAGGKKASGGGYEPHPATSRIHYAEMGHGPLVLLLHGFPDFWYSWRHQLPALAAAGFRAVAPDLRGYNLSHRPDGIFDYDISHIARDVAQLISHLGADRASVVGHDWGGAIAWYFAMTYPSLLDRLAILNAPHPADFVARVPPPGQVLRSWYALYFQLPWLPEASLSVGRFAALRRLLQASAPNPGAFGQADLDRYEVAWSRPGALTAGLNYYRAFVRRNPLRWRRELRPVSAPVRVVWGQRDPALAPERADPGRRWAPQLEVHRREAAGHFVHLDEPARVSSLLVDFLR